MKPGTMVVAKTQLRVCKKPQGECPQCNDLHLCKFFICGNCKFGDDCKYSHTLASQHNQPILIDAGLRNLNGKELFPLLLQNDANLLPEICSYYNRGNGKHGACNYPKTCSCLHVCQHFLQGDCEFGEKCKREHSFNNRVLKILKGRGLSDDNIRKLCKIYRCKSIINQHLEVTDILPIRSLEIKSTTSDTSAAPPTSEADRNEICLFFLRQDCSFKDKCVRMHYQLPYRWQFQDSVSLSWIDMPNMETMEKAYCDPCDNTVKNLGGTVRRLSTASSVSKPNFILTTDWLWYWQVEIGSWEEYGQDKVGDDGGSTASVNSVSLERTYLSEIEEESFSAGGQKYTINFKEMQQQNLHYRTKREVRRRPRFVSTQEVQDGRVISRGTQAASSFPGDSVPANWDKTALPNFGYKVIPLTSSSPEYKKVESWFKGTMKTSLINKIERIQNPVLWNGFQGQKTLMKAKNGGKPVDERHLFHGTEESLLDPICEQNFDWRMCGVHGTLYGKGSYFARDASYSDKYSKAHGGLRRVMFVAHVLVGEFTLGSSSYARPPSKSTSKNLYDSCVDCARDPKIFVVFEKQQIYPEYIIDYS
ncbi:unnamed protein product [Gadus morhua 'NCC']